jgi:hypothetical protein
MLRVSQILSLCGQDIMDSSDDGPCAFGLDVGKKCHLVIGKRLDKVRVEIVKIIRLPGDGDWSEISRLVRKFNCKSGVIDVRPYESAARRFQNEHKMRIFLCEYSESTALSRRYDSKSGLVKVNRTEVFDDTHALVTSPGRLVIPHICPEVRLFAYQVANPVRQFDEKKGVYRYKGDKGPADSEKADHYRNALNYFLLAVDKIGVASSTGRYGFPKKHKKVMNDYARI